MNQFRLGIIGRCLALQPGMPLQNLYHRQLSALLQERDGITLRVSLAGRSDLEPSERMRALFAKKPLDGVLYHMRRLPEPLLFCSRRDHSGKLRYSLHPLFLKQFCPLRRPVYENSQDVIAIVSSMRKNPPHDLFDIPPSPPQLRIVFGVPLLRMMNRWAGKICNMDLCIFANEWFFFERLKSFCCEFNIPLFVLGPIPTVDMLATQKKTRIWKNKCKCIETGLLRDDIPNYFLHVLHDDSAAPLFFRDQIHLNAQGHAFLAKELYPLMAPWIRSSLTNFVQ